MYPATHMSSMKCLIMPFDLSWLGLLSLPYWIFGDFIDSSYNIKIEQKV